MKISIITVSFNSAKTIAQAIDSVMGQSYNNIEYIVVDGASQDETVDMVKSYGKKITHFISEPDHGIYDAMNKGIQLASGDVVGILNSDDFYSHNNVIKKIMAPFKDKNIDCLYGNLVYVDKNDTSKIIRRWISQPYQEGMFNKGWQIAHPTFFVRREVYEKNGAFNTSFKIAADYELTLRLVANYKIKSYFLNETLVCMRTGGMSNKSIANIFRSNVESYRAWKLNDLPVNPLFFLLKPLSKILQYNKIPLIKHLNKAREKSDEKNI